MPPQPPQQQPAPTNFIIFDDYSGGMNTQASRLGLAENELAWCENLMPIAKNRLLGVPAPNESLHTFVGETVTTEFKFDRGSGDSFLVFMSDGSGWSVDTATGLALRFANVGTFSATGPDCTNWLTQRVLIADSKAGYCTFDGTLFVGPGGVSPNIVVTSGGSGYVQGATAAITGGSGSGAVASVQTTGGVVTGVTLTNPGTGYAAADVLTVTISAVSGGTGATANAHAWPHVSPNPTTIAVAFGAVWIAQSRTLLLTGTGGINFGAGYDDFNSANGAVTTTITDTDLIHQITALRFFNGFLYIIGDNSIKQVGSITRASGTTNFNITPLSSDQGTTFQKAITSYDRLLVIGNKVGIHIVFGNSVDKISDQMDGVFQRVDFTQPMCLGVVDINSVRVLFALVRYFDAARGSRSLLLGYINKRWFVASQGDALSYIVSSVVDSSYELWGATTGSDLTRLFARFTVPLPWSVSTSLTAHGNPIRDKRVVRVGITATAPGVSDTVVEIDAEGGSVNSQMAGGSTTLRFLGANGVPINFKGAGGAPLNFVGEGVLLQRSGKGGNTGRFVGATASGRLAGIEIHGIYLEYSEGAMWGAS